MGRSQDRAVTFWERKVPGMLAQPLQSSVLVLNRSFVPVNVTTAKRAFCLLCKALAQVVELQQGQMELHSFESWQQVSEMKRKMGLAEDHSEWVSTVSFEIEVPRIIRLVFQDKFYHRPAGLNRRNIFARDESRCQYCGKKFPSSELSIDHVIPLSLGGKTRWDNVACACAECNKRKGGRLPSEAGMKLIRRPFAPKGDPAIRLKLRLKKYYSWRQFLDDAYWSVPLE